MNEVFQNLNLNEISTNTIEWIEEQGNLAPIFYIFFLAIWVVLLLPCSVIEIVPGFLFGFKIGWTVAILGKSLGTFISLLIGRYLLKDFLQKRIIAKYPIMKAFNKAIEEEGFKVILMIRVTYLPMLIKNYGLAVLDVPIWKIVSASLAAGVPFAAVWAGVGASSKNISEILKGKISLVDLLPEENKEFYLFFGFIFLIIFIYIFISFGKRFKIILKDLEEKQQKQE